MTSPDCCQFQTEVWGILGWNIPYWSCNPRCWVTLPDSAPSVRLFLNNILTVMRARSFFRRAFERSYDLVRQANLLRQREIGVCKVVINPICQASSDCHTRPGAAKGHASWQDRAGACPRLLHSLSIEVKCARPQEPLLQHLVLTVLSQSRS